MLHLTDVELSMIVAALRRDALNYTTSEAWLLREELASYVERQRREMLANDGEGQ